MGVKSAVAAANRKYPDEAPTPSDGDWADVEARDRYHREHKSILNGLGIDE